MLNGKSIAVVIPAYNEESQITKVLETMPSFVDRIVVVNDSSKDNTSQIVLNYINTKSKKLKAIVDTRAKKKKSLFQAENILLEEQEKEYIKFSAFEIANVNPENDRVILINLKKNSGAGAAVAVGYKWCKDQQIACVAKMDGDGQMDPAELQSLCEPIVRGEVDFVKGNRLIHRSAWLVIPKIRYLGNSVLSILTKIASGYWHVSDTQTGYVAISLKALESIRLHDLYPRYGYPNDLLVKLNIAFCTIREVEIKPIYQVGEKSKMKIHKVIPKISWLLFKSFFKRLWIKYFFRDFHPLFLLYNFSFLLLVLDIPIIYKLFLITFFGGSYPISLLILFALFTISGLQFILFAMWMDIQDNERLYK